MGSRLIVVKIGTSSITDDNGTITPWAIRKLAGDVAAQRAAGDRVIVVTSGAIAAGLPVLGLAERRPKDMPTLQAVSAVGQGHLLGEWYRALEEVGLIGGQVLLTPNDFIDRRQYLHARQTLSVLLELGVVPVVNENDAVADDEIRFGDNDRIGALVAHLMAADVLVLLTDAPGLLTADPRRQTGASLIEEVAEVDAELESLAGGAGSRGSGGMASKLAAAKMAAWSGVRAVIADAARPDVIGDAVDGVSGVGTVVVARERRLAARKLWIAFAVATQGTVVVDEGARAALTGTGVSLLPAGVVAVRGQFDSDDAVGIAGPDGAIFAKGLVRHPAAQLERLIGRRTSQLPDGLSHEVVHRDDLVILP